MHQNVRTGYDVSIPTALRMSNLSKHGKKSTIQYTARAAAGSSCAVVAAGGSGSRKSLTIMPLGGD